MNSCTFVQLHGQSKNKSNKPNTTTTTTTTTVSEQQQQRGGLIGSLHTILPLL
jgi:hypothetical protein